MAVTASDFTVLMGEAVLGESVRVTILRPGSDYGFRFAYTFAGTAGEVKTADMVQRAATKTCVRYDWTLPLHWQELLPADVSGQGTLTVYVEQTGTVSQGAQGSLCTLTKPFTARVPEETVPAAAVHLEAVNDNPVLASWRLYVRGKSRLHYRVEASGGAGAAVAGCHLRWLGVRAQGLLGNTPLLATAGTATPEAEVTDSRGRTALWRGEEMTVWDYHLPTLDDVTLTRCDSQGTPAKDGGYVYMAASSQCTSLGGRNSVTLQGRIRPAGGAWGAYTTLTDGQGAVLGGAPEIGTACEAEISAVDTIGSARTIRRILPGSGTVFHLRPGGQGAAFGKRAESAGLSCAWDAAFDGDVAVAGSLTVGGHTLLDTIYPVGALYLCASDASPESVLGGTWQRVNDCLLLAAGESYGAGSSVFAGVGSTGIPCLTVYVWQRTA